MAGNDPEERIPLTNPTDAPWKGEHDSRSYWLKAGETRKDLPRWLVHFLEIQARHPGNGKARLLIGEPTPDVLKPEGERGDGGEAVEPKEFKLPCEWVLQGCGDTFKSRDTAGYRMHVAAHVRAKEREAKVVTEKPKSQPEI